MFRPYLSDHVRPNTLAAAADDDDDGVKKLLELSKYNGPTNALVYNKTLI
jgi:hypothetical protein